MNIKNVFVIAYASCLIAASVSVGHADEASAAAGALRPLAKGETGRVVRPSDLRIPPEFGVVSEVYDGGSPQVAVLIQDGHGIYPTQRNAADIIEGLIAGHGLNLVLVEGLVPDTLARERRQPLAGRSRSAEQRLADGQITGEQYLYLNSDYPLALESLEDADLYQRSLAAQAEAVRARGPALEAVQAIDATVSTLKPHVYNQGLALLDAYHGQFLARVLKSDQYAGKLCEIAGALGFSLAPYRDFALFVEVKRRGEVIDYTQVGQETSRVYQELFSQRRLGQGSDFQAFRAMATRVQQRQATQLEYHRLIKRLMDKAQMRLDTYPHLSGFIDYLERHASIDYAAMLKDMEAITRAMEQAVAQEGHEQILLQVADDMDIVTKMINLELNSEELDRYLADEARFSAENIVKRLS
ncbi:MAG: hypothetical protein WCG78_07745, partial [Candidatus Omnitrophota bacterium]